MQSKNGKRRRVPLTTELRAELVKRAHSGGYIFGQGKDGVPPTQAATSVAFARLAKKLNGVSHHVLRHTGASAMVAAGVSLRVVQEIGGWTSLRMLERYAHPTGDEMERAVRVLAETTGAKTGSSANRTITAEEPETRQRVVGLEDWDGVPNGIRTRVLALKGPRPRPLDDGDAEGEANVKSYHAPWNSGDGAVPRRSLRHGC